MKAKRQRAVITVTDSGDDALCHATVVFEPSIKGKTVTTPAGLVGVTLAKAAAQMIKHLRDQAVTARTEGTKAR